MPCGAASSLTATLPSASVFRTARRVGSANAANTLSSSSSEYLTIRFSILYFWRMTRKRFARREDLGLTPAEFAVLRRLDNPRKIQTFLYGLGQNFELKGDTCRPVRMVLRTRTAHCIEGAMLAAAALWIQGEPPLVMDMRAYRDYDHVIALFRRNGLWGAFSKTNGIGLRCRDPLFRSLRELSLSYLHEYSNKAEIKTLREFSGPGDLRRFDPKMWVSGEKNCWEIPERLDDLPHYPVLRARQFKAMLPRDPFERRVGAMLQYRKPRALIEKELRKKRRRK